MNIFLSQLFIVAQNRFIEEWMNIFFFVVVAAIWVIGAIVKAKAEQSKQQKKKQLPRKGPPQPSSLKRDSAELILEKFLGLGSSSQPTPKHQHPGMQVTRPKVPYSRPANDRFSVKTKSEKKPQFSLPKQSLEPNIQELTPIDTNLKELPEFTSDALKKLKSSRPKVPTEPSLSQYIFDFTDTDSLKKAILYYEILGRPLSMRETPNSIDS